MNDVRQELGKNFIEYAVACNTDRAIPDANDGLKPVAKRILWGALDKTGCVSNKPHVKCAKLVGDIMGTYHPHGDSSIYGALVRLSQPWVMRYPLVDWHGNNGNVMGDGPAAMRYTETRLSKLTEEGMLEGVKKDGVDFIPNYDETTKEPVSLPSIFPNLLCNPNAGIGVAMACSWAPHNLKEVAQAINDYIDGKEPMLPGPDFPTGGIIINKDSIPAIMRTGHGSVKVRAKYEVNKQNLIFTEIPYGQTVEGLMAEIGKVADEKEVDGISDIRDESNKKGIRIVVECERGATPEIVANKLFAKTNLQSSFSYNQVALINKVPTELNLKDCIKIYIEHNIECLIKESNFDKEKAFTRLEIVNGLLKALADIDNIIALIKKSDNSTAAKEALIAKYEFTENQAKAILAMRLSSLSKLEGIDLNNEKADLEKKVKELDLIINNKNRQIEIIKERLSTLVKKYGDNRRTELVQIIDTTKETKTAEIVEPKDVVVFCTKGGYIKRIPKENFKPQRKNGKGLKNKDDAVLASISTNTTDTLMIFTKSGKMYRMLVDDVPEGTNATKGTSLFSLLSLENNDDIVMITSLYYKTKAKYIVFFTKNGLIKKTKLEEYTGTKKKTGIQAIKIKDGDGIANVTFLADEKVVLVTKKGFAIKFETKSIDPTSRVTMGVKGIKLAEGDEVLLGLPVHDEVNDYFTVITEDGCGRRLKIKNIPLQNKGGIGAKVCADGKKIAAAAMLAETDEAVIIGTPNNICISAKDIPVLENRMTEGSKLINGSKVNYIIKL